MDMEKHLIIEQQGVLGIISLNRVANLNALSIEMIHQIHMQFGDMATGSSHSGYID